MTKYPSQVYYPMLEGKTKWKSSYVQAEVYFDFIQQNNIK